MARRNKTHKGAKKRFRATANGKIKFQRVGKRHLNSHMSGDEKRRLDQAAVVTGTVAKKYIRVMQGQ